GRCGGRSAKRTADGPLPRRGERPGRWPGTSRSAAGAPGSRRTAARTTGRPPARSRCASGRPRTGSAGRRRRARRTRPSTTAAPRRPASSSTQGGGSGRSPGTRTATRRGAAPRRRGGGRGRPPRPRPTGPSLPPRFFAPGPSLPPAPRRARGPPIGSQWTRVPALFRKLFIWQTYWLRPKRTALYRLDTDAHRVVPLVDLPSAGDPAVPSVARLGPDDYLVAN